MVALFWDLCWRLGCALIGIVPSDRDHNRVTVKAWRDRDRVLLAVIGTRATIAALDPIVAALDIDGE